MSDPAPPPPVLELRGIRKSYGPVQALRGADFVLGWGEIHALLGENGAGKSTLMQIAYGLVRADEGVVLRDGRPAAVRSPADARALGLGMVHQHFTSVPALTVAENVALATGEPTRRGWEAALAVSPVVRRLAEGLAPGDRVEELSVGLRQRLEIVKALAGRAGVLLLDEPTAVLAPQEVEEVLEAVRAFARAGGSVVLITHKLGEALAVAGRVTVLRQGSVAFSGAVVGQTRATLAAAMLGESADDMARAELAAERWEPPAGGGPVVVALRDATVVPLEGRGPGLREASLQVRSGEIVGVAAIEGNGQRELLLAVAGLLRPVSGGLEVAEPVALVPEDRSTEGLIPSLTLTENLALGFGTEAPWVRGPWLDWRRAREETRALIPAFDIRAPGAEVAVAALSGGNQQKLVLARALARKPAVLVAENPTRGLDVRAAAGIHGRLREAARDGVAVLLYSGDLDEVAALACRTVVVAGGRVREMPANAGLAEVGRAMLGLNEDTDR